MHVELALTFTGRLISLANDRPPGSPLATVRARALGVGDDGCTDPDADDDQRIHHGASLTKMLEGQRHAARWAPSCTTMMRRVLMRPVFRFPEIGFRCRV